MRLLLVLGIASSIFMLTCKNVKKAENQEFPSGRAVSYAKGFNITRTDYGWSVNIHNPWQKAEGISYSYRFRHEGHSDHSSADSLYPAEAIKIPVENIICLSTTHIGYIDELGELNSVKGISGKNYIYNPHLRKKIEQGEIPDIGYQQNLDYEQIIKLKPDLVLGYSISADNVSYLNKLNELNIPVLFIAEYLENHPLGKAEWIKVMGILFDKYDLAVRKFNKVDSAYLETLGLMNQEDNQPVILTGMPWKDKWYVPGGDSFLARFIEDAGGNYIWSNNDLRRSKPLDLEKVFAQGHDADIWIHPGNSVQYDDIRNADKRLAAFHAYGNKKVFNNNKRMNQFGGNDYWESGVINPHIILKDMLKIFHPELLPHYEMVYYRKLE